MATSSNGQILWFVTFITDKAKSVLHTADVQNCLERHAWGDWGECSSEDAAKNDRNREQRLELRSEYTDRNGNNFWIVTEDDNSTTTILLPDEYEY